MEIASVLLGRDAHQHKPTTGKRLSKEELDTSPSGHAVNFYQPAAKPIVDAGGLVIYEKSSALGCYTQTHYQHRQSAHFFRQWMRKVLCSDSEGGGSGAFSQASKDRKILPAYDDG